MLVKQPKQDKFSTPFDPKPFEIIEKKGNMITAKQEDKSLTRNSSHFKKVNISPPKSHNKSNENRNTDRPENHTSTKDNSRNSDAENSTRSTRIKKPPEYLKDYV